MSPTSKVHDIVLAPPDIVTRRKLVFVALRAHKCCGLKCDTAMLKAALTSCNLSGPLAAKDICVTLHIPTVSRDKVPPAPHEAVANV